MDLDKNQVTKHFFDKLKAKFRVRLIIHGIEFTSPAENLSFAVDTCSTVRYSLDKDSSQDIGFEINSSNKSVVIDCNKGNGWEEVTDEMLETYETNLRLV